MLSVGKVFAKVLCGISPKSPARSAFQGVFAPIRGGANTRGATANAAVETAHGRGASQWPWRMQSIRHCL
jgi:hypothetical protein